LNKELEEVGTFIDGEHDFDFGYISGRIVAEKLINGGFPEALKEFGRCPNIVKHSKHAVIVAHWKLGKTELYSQSNIRRMGFRHQVIEANGHLVEFRFENKDPSLFLEMTPNWHFQTIFQ